MAPSPRLRRKIIIFPEPRDTLEYLQQKIAAIVGADAVVVVHGVVAREARRGAIAAFNSDTVVRVMIANDAAGELLRSAVSGDRFQSRVNLVPGDLLRVLGNIPYAARARVRLLLDEYGTLGRPNIRRRLS